MSEYQYYEFQAIDRPLNEAQMRALRAISTRARITSTSFVNTYNFGDFKGDPDSLVEKYFDAFLYVANWGTHRLMWRLPRKLLGKDILSLYCKGDGVSFRENGDHVILEFNSEIDPEDWEEGEEWLASLMPLRPDLLAGDHRSLYLGWLHSLQCEDLDDDDVEPPVPAGLGELTGALRSFAEFLRIDDDLIEVAAEGGTPLHVAEPGRREFQEWVQALSEKERTNLLIEFVEGKDMHLRASIVRRIQKGLNQGPSASRPRRTVGELRAAVADFSERKRRLAAERAAKEKERKAKQDAVAREKYLNELAKREQQVWRQVDALAEAKQRKEYDQAVKLLKDLKDLGSRKGATKEYEEKSRRLRERHARKHSFVKMLEQAGL